MLPINAKKWNWHKRTRSPKYFVPNPLFTEQHLLFVRGTKSCLSHWSHLHSLSFFAIFLYSSGFLNSTVTPTNLFRTVSVSWEGSSSLQYLPRYSWCYTSGQRFVGYKLKCFGDPIASQLQDLSPSFSLLTLCSNVIQRTKHHSRVSATGTCKKFCKAQSYSTHLDDFVQCCSV